MELRRGGSPMTVSARSVTELLAKHLEVDRARVVPTARLFEDLGASPLALIQVALALEERFDIPIAPGEVEDFVTVEDVMACVVRARNSRTSRPPRVATRVGTS
jgi:acyl carrier protein